jgi:galactose mutarotase-like enzyme
VFAPNSDALIATVKLRVIQGLTRSLAGIVEVVDVTVAGDGATPPAPGTLEVTVTYTLVETQTTASVQVTVT